MTYMKKKWNFFLVNSFKSCSIIVIQISIILDFMWQFCRALWEGFLA